MPPKANKRTPKRATRPRSLTQKVLLSLATLLLGAGGLGLRYVNTNAQPHGGAVPPAASAAPANVADFQIQVLQQLDTLNRRAERMEQKFDAKQSELQGKIERLQTDVDALKVEKH